MIEVREQELPLLKTTGCFVGGAVSNLCAEGKGIALRTFQKIGDQVKERWGWKAVIPALVEMPGSRVGDVARGLNQYLQTSVCDCCISILSLWTPYSNGTAYELSLMTAVGVPVLFLRHEDFPLPETFYRPDLDILAELTFRSDEDLLNRLFSWLDDPHNFKRVEERAELGLKTRTYIEGLGTPQNLERARCNRDMPVDVLAQRAGLPLACVQDFLGGNYSAFARLTVNQLVRLTCALDEPLFDALSPYHVEEKLQRADRLILEAGITYGWDVQEFSQIIAMDPRWKRIVEGLPTEKALAEIDKRHRALFGRGCRGLRRKLRRRGNGHNQGKLFES
jgi:hypothetical protein